MASADDDRAEPLNIPGYTIIRPIGQGGMGEVYLATQESLGRPVALKILSLVQKVDPAEQLARFRRGAELMARVHHPNIVAVYDFGIIDRDGASRPYLVMEFVEGGDLRQRMVPGRPLDIELVLPLVPPLAAALECLHAEGILHRDLKPENILMPEGSTPKVTDFGLAMDTEIGSQTGIDHTMGTLGYIAPEQQYRLGVDDRTDQYSLAALMYELLTGHKPLGILKPPSVLNRRLGPAVDAVLLRGLQEDPDDRYPTVRELGEALERALSRRVSARSRRRRFQAALALMAGAALASIAGAAGFRARMGTGTGMARPAAAGAVHAAAMHPVSHAVPVPVPAPAPAAARLINRLGMTLVLIPAGEFLMGAPDADPSAKPIEKPRHPVRISRPFYLGAHEVTVGQFRAFVAATGYVTEAESSGEGGFVYNSVAKRFEPHPEYNWRNPGLPLPQGDDEPVVQMSYNDAMAFCRWLSQTEHRSYRLPTEAEWEYGCRAGSTTRWCMGDDPAELDQFGWIRDQVGCTTHPVGGKRPNRFGLYDMHGNVWEWCFDKFAPYADTDQPVVDPQGTAPGRAQVLRGGACARAEIDRTRSASRLRRGASSRYTKYGFRVCSPVAETVVER
jgi:formylglycine-generating enzyme required for sulfatase activity